jgi:hypothetical protein
MKNRKCVAASTLTIIALAMIGMVLCANNSAKASTPSPSDVLNILPSDCQFVFGMNVQKFVASSLYTNAKQKKSAQMGNDLSQFVNATGVDPERDIHFLMAAGRTKEKSKGNGVIIAVGKFDQNAITSFIKSKSTPTVQDYNGTQVLAFPVPDSKGNAASKGLVFLSNGELALGDVETLKAVLDVKANGSIMLNAKMASLIKNVNLNDMFWFAGNADAILANASIKTPMGAQIPSLQDIVGSLNITDSVTGTITASALDSTSAANLAGMVNGLIAFGKMAATQSPELQMLFGGVKVSQNSNQVSLDLNFSADMLDKLDQVFKTPRPKAGV